jgi:ComF family protein
MNKLVAMYTILLDLLFPREACEILCDSLPVSKLEQCAENNEVVVPIACIAPLSYRHHLVQQVIFAMKYYGHTRAPKLLAEAITPYIVEELSERRMFGTFHKPLIIPIPLHKTRKVERGFNQSERIASSLIEHLSDKNVSGDFNTLIRKKNTSSQVSHHNRQTRIKNMKQAFAVLDSKRIEQRDIILIDDVVTTGATLSEAKKTLLRAGASNVLCVAVAH